MLAPSSQELGAAEAWQLVLALARRARRGPPLADGARLALDDRGELVDDGGAVWAIVDAGAPRGWARGDASSSVDFDELVDLYGPLTLGAAARVLTFAHLAQTLDGRIALRSGQSKFISGQDDLIHTHRLRALSDALIVGRRTIEEDDPQLTTRLCDGPSPVRVVIDPLRRLGERHHVFEDGRPTLLLCDDAAARLSPRHGCAEVVGIAPVDGALPVPAILAALRSRGLGRVFLEGGGVTVSRFLQARALHRLQLTVAPRLFGSGIPSISLPEIAELRCSLSLAWRTFRLGQDVLFDCTVTA